METQLSISGMTCGHCVASVTEELSALEGVKDVRVDLVADGVSTAVVTSTEPIAPELLGEAVAEAGYTVVG
ncbi:heavy-metal-associated domain-containing protein [Arthrobacter sp. 3Tela_A]|uniref:heavy-metal-associated domain-containing protein n=1 Tax=Arthrobacter sp. 3Tela_A TaxID=3093743 RepID=UPI003BB6BE67